MLPIRRFNRHGRTIYYYGERVSFITVFRFEEIVETGIISRIVSPKGSQPYYHVKVFNALYVINHDEIIDHYKKVKTAMNVLSKL